MMKTTSKNAFGVETFSLEKSSKALYIVWTGSIKLVEKIIWMRHGLMKG